MMLRVACCLCVVVGASAPCLAGWREQALDLVRRSTDAVAERQIGTLEQPGAISRYTVWYAYDEYLLYRRARDPRRRERALALCDAVADRVLGGDDALHSAQASQLQSALAELVQIRRWLVEEGTADPQWLSRFDRALAAAADQIVEFVPERETMNRASYCAASCQAAAAEFPDHPGATGWRGYADAVWGDFTSQGDTVEDACGYNGLWLLTMMVLARERGEEALFASAPARALLDRWARQVTPAGTLPDYGDCYFHGPLGLWAAGFARAATLTGEGRYERLARELFEYQRSQCDTQTFTDPSPMHWLAWACQEPGPQEAEPAFASACNTRRDRYGRELLDKLIMRDARPRAADWPACFTMVNLHELGYHGHADAGALVSLVRGDTVYLHEMGYSQDEDRYHNTLLVLPPEAPFPDREREFVAGRWNYAVLDLRRPFTYTGREAPDLTRITALFFRLDDEDALNTEFDLFVDDLRVTSGDPLAADGTQSLVLADFEAPTAAAGWTHAQVALGPEAGRCLRSHVSFTDEGASERHWVTWTLPEPLDLSGHERIEFRWQITDNRLDAELGAQFGLQEGERTQRWRFGSYPTYREVTDCHLLDFGRAAYGQVRLRLADRGGAWHRQLRQVALLKPSGALLVRDTLSAGADCELQLGQTWHVEQVADRGDHWFIGHSEIMYPDRDVTWRCAPGDLLVQFLPEDGHNIGATEREIVYRGRQIPQRWILYDHWAATARAGDRVSFTCLLWPLTAGERPEVKMLRHDGEMCLVGIGEDLVLLNPAGTQVDADLDSDASFCVIEREEGRVAHCCGEAGRLAVAGRTLKAPGERGRLEF